MALDPDFRQDDGVGGVALHVVILDLIQDPERRAVALLGSGS